jgi:uracil-DNA glycosylase
MAPIAPGGPFTGDYAGVLLYSKPCIAYRLCRRGHNRSPPSDGLELIDCRITNAVKCLPPAEQAGDRPKSGPAIRHLAAELVASPKDIRVILALGLVAHKAVLMALGLEAQRPVQVRPRRAP